MNNKEQLELWVAGQPKCPNDKGECCPDFSCCTGKIVLIDIRQRFVKACYEEDFETMEQMCSMFLGEMIEYVDVEKKIYISPSIEPISNFINQIQNN